MTKQNQDCNKLKINLISAVLLVFIATQAAAQSSISISEYPPQNELCVNDDQGNPLQGHICLLETEIEKDDPADARHFVLVEEWLFGERSQSRTRLFSDSTLEAIRIRLDDAANPAYPVFRISLLNLPDQDRFVYERPNDVRSPGNNRPIENPGEVWELRNESVYYGALVEASTDADTSSVVYTFSGGALPTSAEEIKAFLRGITIAMALDEVAHPRDLVFGTQRDGAARFQVRLELTEMVGGAESAVGTTIDYQLQATDDPSVFVQQTGVVPPGESVPDPWLYEYYYTAQGISHSDNTQPERANAGSPPEDSGRTAGAVILYPHITGEYGSDDDPLTFIAAFPSPSKDVAVRFRGFGYFNLGAAAGNGANTYGILSPREGRIPNAAEPDYDDDPNTDELNADELRSCEDEDIKYFLEDGTPDQTNDFITGVMPFIQAVTWSPKGRYWRNHGSNLPEIKAGSVGSAAIDCTMYGEPVRLEYRVVEKDNIVFNLGSAITEVKEGDVEYAVADSDKDNVVLDFDEPGQKYASLTDNAQVDIDNDPRVRVAEFEIELVTSRMHGNNCWRLGFDDNGVLNPIAAQMRVQNTDDSCITGGAEVADGVTPTATISYRYSGSLSSANAEVAIEDLLNNVGLGYQGDEFPTGTTSVEVNISVREEWIDPVPVIAEITERQLSIRVMPADDPPLVQLAAEREVDPATGRYVGFDPDRSRVEIYHTIGEVAVGYSETINIITAVDDGDEGVEEEITLLSIDLRDANAELGSRGLMLSSEVTAGTVTNGAVTITVARISDDAVTPFDVPVALTLEYEDGSGAVTEAVFEVRIKTFMGSQEAYDAVVTQLSDLEQVYATHNPHSSNPGLTLVPSGVACQGCTIQAAYVVSDYNDSNGALTDSVVDDTCRAEKTCTSYYHTGEDGVLLPAGYSYVEWVLTDGNGNEHVAPQEFYVAPIMVLQGVNDKTVYTGDSATGASEQVEFSYEIVSAYPGLAADADGAPYYSLFVGQLDSLLEDTMMPVSATCENNPQGTTCSIEEATATNLAATVGNYENGDLFTIDVNLDGNVSGFGRRFVVANDLTVRASGEAESVAPIIITNVAVSQASVAQGTVHTVSAITAELPYDVVVEGSVTEPTRIVVETAEPIEIGRANVQIKSADVDGDFRVTLEDFSDDRISEHPTSKIVTISVYETTVTGTLLYEINYAITNYDPSILEDLDNDGVSDSAYADLNEKYSVRFEGAGGTRVGALTVPEIEGYSIALGSDARSEAQESAQIGAEVVGTPDGYDGEGVYDFIVAIPEGADRAYVAFGLLKALDTDKSYYKYDGNDWDGFASDDSNSIYSAPAVIETTRVQQTISCPAPIPSAVWSGDGRILQEGHQCVLLVIEDGGPNDNDPAGNRHNRVVYDPGAPGTGIRSPGSVSGGGGGGGSTGPWMLLLLLIALSSVAIAKRRRCR